MAQPIPEVECISTTCTFIAVLMIVTTPMCVHAVTPLPIKQAISLVPEVVGRSVLARWIGLCLEWFGCQENANVRTFGWKSWVPNRGAAGELVIFVPVHLNNLTSRSRTVAIPCRLEEA